MWKYILASILTVIGIVEIVLALNKGLRDALMQTSPLRLKHAESTAFLLAGISAVMLAVLLLFAGCRQHIAPPAHNAQTDATAKQH